MDGSPPRQRLSGEDVAPLGWPIDAIPTFVEDDDVEVHLMPGVIPEDEVARGRVIAGHVVVAPFPERSYERRGVLLLDNDVEVSVRPGLLSETRIDRPAAVDPDPNAERFDEVEEV